ncbi:MAG: HAD family hydrolase [Phycisphaerae bacterium]|jgi:phosphoglycolate phosphatase|nr:HAD family hydrolase [Phycisphaerae bacterium]
MKYQAAIFDLDGTLINSLDDLADATNWGLTQLGLPTHAVMDYRYLVGAGRTELCRRALPADKQALLETLISLMTKHYSEHYFDKTRPYPGITEMLEKLAHTGIKLAILSNKPHDFVLLTMKHLFPKFHFDLIYGDRDDIPRKPDPTGAINIAKELGVSPAQTAYVGDTSIDMETANRAQMYAIGVSWGFREKAELIESGSKVIVDTPDELFQVITGS